MIPKILKRKRTVSDITSSLNTIVSDLLAHAELKVLEADKLERQIEVLAEQRLDAITERTAAEKIAQNVSKLLDF